MNRWGGRAAAALTAAVLARDGYRCRFPGCTAIATTADHHPVPRDAGGPDTLANLRAACLHHNAQAGARYGNAKRAGYPPERM